MYKVSCSELPALPPRALERELVLDEENTDEPVGYKSILVHIRPPVQLNADAVERYLSHGDFGPVNRNVDYGPDVKDVVLLGSTQDETTIYVAVQENLEQLRGEVTADVVQLLQFMGAQAIAE